MVEICSIKNRRSSVFEEGTTSVTESAYVGVDCDCGGTTVKPSDGLECGHAPFLSDPKIIQFLLNSSIDGAAQVPSASTEAFANLSNEELAKYEDECYLITKN
jgi:hypothetical protein